MKLQLEYLDLPAVILAGGKGTRLQEETRLIPKPLVQIGKTPIIVHIMNIFLAQGVNSFIVLTGYKSEMFDSFFYNSENWTPQIALDKGFRVDFLSRKQMSIRVVNTGLHSLTGERVRHLQTILDSDFFLTYGDGLANVNLQKLLNRNISSNALVTLSAVRPPARFGALELGENNLVKTFSEKHSNTESLINGGFMMMKKESLQFIQAGSSLESDFLPELAKLGRLSAHVHLSFWHAMDTLRDKDSLNEIWANNKAPWLEIENL